MHIDTPDQVLAREPMIRYDRSHWGGQLGELYLEGRLIKPRVRFDLDAMDAIAVLVNRGLGISILPNWPPPWPEGIKLQKIAIDAQKFSRQNWNSLASKYASHPVNRFTDRMSGFDARYRNYG